MNVLLMSCRCQNVNIQIQVLAGQETIHSRIGKKKQVKTSIDEIAEKLDQVSKKLEAEEIDLRALQVNTNTFKS